MLEIFLLVVLGGGIAAFARKRGGTPWIWVVAFVVVYYSLAVLLTMLLGPGASYLALFVVAGLMFVCIFYLVGFGRRASDRWQCPDCQLFNDPNTLRCGCGYDYPAA